MVAPFVLTRLPSVVPVVAVVVVSVHLLSRWIRNSPSAGFSGGRGGGGGYNSRGGGGGYSGGGGYGGREGGM